MREKSNSIQIKRKTIVYIVVILIALASVTPALADYIGPKRTVTETTPVCKVVLYECQYVAAKDIWKYKSSNSWSCSNESKPWQAYSGSSRACNSGNSGYEYWAREDSQQDVTVTYPPATISSSLQNCTLNNGWCTTAPQLSLSGNEPVAGHNIIAIEGSLNGQNFACPNASCNVPLNEGDNILSYWALSSFGDSSVMDTFSTKVDSQLPNIAGTLSGTSGSNGWYVSPVSFNASASDATSGLASFACTLDGTALGSCSSITLNGEGAHTLVLTASDNAGNTRILTQNASLDTQNPTLNAGLSGTLGSNSWYTSAALNASASDSTPGSGLSTFEYNLDNSNWMAFPASGVLALPNGKHSLDIRAIDNAGRTTSSSKSFWLDSVTPGISLNPSGTLGTNNWYTTNPNVAASSSDETSGIDVLEYSLDNNAWTTYTTPVSLTDGLHNISFWAQDQAGLVKQVDHTYQVDTRPPQIAGSISGASGSNGWYISDVTLSASASDPMPGSGLDAFTYTLNNSAATAYTAPLSLTDGQHTIQFNAQDQAGLTYSIDRNIKVDTTHPSLTISTTFPNWIKDAITLNGIAGDNGSGLSKVEISTDHGQTWQDVSGSAFWDYDWDTKNNTDGPESVHVRAIDKAGLITEETVNVRLDNHAPKITLPDSWFQWDSVTLDVWDNFSGISEARVEVSDPEGRWPKRVIKLDPDQFPLDFKWDRRFGDDTVAPFGTYNVKVLAFDKLGNMAHHSASIKVFFGLLPSGPTATLQPYSRTDATPTAIYTATSISSPTVTPTSVISVFGDVEPTAQATSTAASVPTPRVMPTQTGVLDWLESIFVPNANASDQVTEIKSDDLGSADSRSPDSQSNVLWGAAAAAMVGAATSYAAEERRKQQEEKERQAALEAQEEERHDKIQAKHMEKMETQRAQEAAWEEARHEQQDFIGGVAAKLDRQDQKEEAERIAEQLAHREKIEEKKKKEEAAELQAGLAAYYNATRPDVQETPKSEQNWWEKTKAFVSENMIQPFNTNFYEPFVEPVVEWRRNGIEARNEFVKDAVSWLDEKFYQPNIQPSVEKIKQVITDKIAQVNEDFYQPHIAPIVRKITDAATDGITWLSESVQQHIKPALDKEIQKISNDIELLNQKVYQPYLKPVVSLINEKVYQPYIEPVVERDIQAITGTLAWINDEIYQPIFEPVVSDINKYIYQPLAQKVSNWWDEYGEWVHGALNAAGLIPGFGDISDVLNSVVYLCEGRYLDAAISAICAVPIIGNFGAPGKMLFEAGQDVVDTVVKEFAGEIIEKAAKEAFEESAEKVVVGAAEQLIENQWVQKAISLVGCIPGVGATSTTMKGLIQLAAGHYVDATISAVSMMPIVGSIAKIGQEIVESSLQRLIKEATEELGEKLIKETTEELAEKLIKGELELAAKEVSEEIIEVVAKEGGEELIEKAANETFEEASEILFKEVGEEVTEKTTKEVSEEVLEKTIDKAKNELKDNATKDFIEKITGEDTDKDTQKTIEEQVAKNATEETPQRVSKTELIESLKQQHGDEMVEKFLPFCEKYGIDPYEVLTRPPAEGQTLIGWGLGIEDSANPANHPLVELKLTKDEFNNILEKSTVRPDSKVVVLGFGGGEKPYYTLSDEIGGCHLSLSNDAWAPFDKARANFLVDINIPFVEKAIDERKIFIFNVDTDVITDSANVRRFSLPELRLIEMEKNNYAQVPVGEYTAFVPKESLDTFEQELPTDLFQLGEQ